MANNTVILTDPEDQSTTYFPVTVREAVLDLGPFSGSTSTNSGSSGLVPSPGISDRFGLLCGSGSWMTPQEPGYLYFEPTNGWTTTSSTGGGGITQEFTLNGTTYSGSSLSGTGGIYAPTSSGVSDAILIGGYSNTPAWYVPGNLGGFLKFRGENLGWTVDTSSYMPTGSFSFYWKNQHGAGSSSHNWATLTPGGSLTLVGSDGVTLDASVGDPSTLYISTTVGIRSLYMGVGLTSSVGSLISGSATISLEPATTSSIGGLAVGRIESSVTPVILNGGTTLALERGVQDVGFVRVPITPSTPASIGHPGLLTVAADVDSANGYINDTAVVAVPIFYGSIEDLKQFGGRQEGGTVEYDDYVSGESFTGHYINVRDIFNGIIRDEEMMRTLWQILQEWTEEFHWPWWKE